MSTKAQLRVFADQESLSEAAAALMAEVAAAAVEQRGRFLMALSGGGTPEPVYRLLAGQGYREQVDWTAGYYFWGDERCVPPMDPGSNFGQAKRLLLDPLGVPDGNILRVKGELDPAEAAADYRQQLAQFAVQGQAWPVLDLALMGLGSDGHTASLFPGPPAPGEGRLAAVAVTANYGGRPAQRVSLTPPVFNSARVVLFLVSGASKAQVVASVLAPDADTVKWPAARIRPTSGQLHYFLDQAAAAMLPSLE